LIYIKVISSKVVFWGFKMLSFSLDIGLRKQLLLAFALILSPALVNANNLDVDVNAIPKISSEYFSSMEMKPRFWLSPNTDESGNRNDITVNSNLTIKVIDGGVNVPEYALKLVKTKDNLVRLDRIDN